MKILVTGYEGQLGFDVVREGKHRGLQMFAPVLSELDITNKQEVFKCVHSLQPDIIVHCAAYTAVDKAEDDKKTCYDVNVNGTEYLAEAARECKAKFVYISTDYIFDGTGENPYTESDKPNPQSQYGLTKYEGEKIVQSLLEKVFIVRVSWTFGLNGENFVKTMLKLAESKDELYIVGDQYGSPTYTYDVAHFLLDLVETDCYGIYHVTNEGFCSWAEFAEEIFQQASKKVKVNIISTDEYPTRATRPKNSRMSKRKLRDKGFMLLPSWQEALSRYMSELKQEKSKSLDYN